MKRKKTYTVRHSLQSRRGRREARDLPHLFGRGGRDRALIALAINGALHVRHLARTIDSDSRCTFTMVERLVESGIAVKRQHPGGRKYVQLNKELPSYPALLRLLRAMDRHWPTRRTKTTARWYMPFFRSLSERQRESIFQSNVRSRVLLYVQAMRKTNMMDMITALRMCSETALYVVDALERESVLRSKRIGQHRVVELNPEFVVAKQLKGFLEILVQESPKYTDFRNAFAHRKSAYRAGRRAS